MIPAIVFLCFSASLRDLGHEDYRVREDSQARLQRWDFLTWRWCQHVERTSPDPEARWRAREIVEEHLRIGVPTPIHSLTPHDWAGYWYRLRQEPNLNGELSEPSDEFSWVYDASGQTCRRGPPADDGNGKWYLVGVQARNGEDESLPWIAPYLAGLSDYSVKPWGDNWPLWASQQASRNLARDLILWGIPPPAVRWLLEERR